MCEEAESWGGWERVVRASGASLLAEAVWDLQPITAGAPAPAP